MVLRLPTVVMCVLLTAGCSHAPDASQPMDHVTATERLASRHRVVADGLEVRATLWSPQLVQRAVQTSAGSAKAKAELGRRLTKRYGGGPSFTVVVDIARRRPEPVREEAEVFDPRHWSFTLGETIRPESIDIVAVDRFPTEGGGHHQRLVFDAHFPKGAANGEELELRVLCAADFGWRKALGRSMARRGVTLRWKG